MGIGRRSPALAAARPGRFGRRRARTPPFIQLEATECGAVCLGIVLAYLGRWASLEELREACAVGRDGCTAADIVRAAEDYGLRTSSWRKQPAELRRMPMPSILFWEFNHFVVLEGFGRGRYYLNDPAHGHRTVSEEEFDRAFTGVVMVFEPGPEFRGGGVRTGLMRLLWPWLREVKGPLAFAAACGMLLAVPGLALPVLLGVFVDYVMSGQEAAWGGIVVAAAGASAVLVYLLTWLQQRCLRRLAIRLSVVHTDRFVSRLFRLPMRHFAHRYAGDLMARAQLVDKVAAVGSTQFVGVAIEFVMSALFLTLMFVYDPLLAAAVAALGGANVLFTRLVTRRRTAESREMLREQGVLAGVTISGLRGIESLRATATENEHFVRWTGSQACELEARQRFSEFGHVIASFPGLFQALGGAAVLGLGGWQVMSGEMTLGALMGFYVVAGNFLAPIGRFVQFADVFQTLEADMQRLNDVVDTAAVRAPKPREGRSGAATLHGRLRLAGRVELRNVTFGYRPNHPPLVENLSLIIEPGQRVAVVGPTGSGKSTLVMLISGVYAPWSGEILFDGVPHDEIPPEILTASIAVVDQNPVLFAATVRENLTMWNPAVTDPRLIAAARDALIHDDIVGRARDGYDSAVEEGGRNFSGGQRQRLEIARALVNDPSVLLLDEATSALDPVSEMRIDDALRRRGCTCLIVAHRLSTIRDSDQIIVLDQGREAQRGTHEQLLAVENGLYHRLVNAN